MSGGAGRKTVRGQDGALEIAVPRDRDGSFEPRLIPKGQTRIDGLDDKIIAMYARGMSVRDIRAHLEELYGLEVSPDLISRVTDAVMDEVREWRSRALDAVYPVVIFDALRVKIRDKDSRMVREPSHRGAIGSSPMASAVHLVLGITGDGQREVLGLWIADTEGAKFWLSVMTELERPRRPGRPDRRRGRPEGLSRGDHGGLSSGDGADLRRSSRPPLGSNFCSWKDRKAVAAGLRAVYGAETAEAARDALEAFDGTWGRQYPSIAQAWRRAWEEVIPFFAFGPRSAA